MNPSETSPGACCDSMLNQLNWKCADHPSLRDCPDALVGRFGNERKYGLFVHDGGSSFVEIAHCPWCGTRLRPEQDPPTPSPVHNIADGAVVLWAVDGTVHIKTTNKFNDPVELNEHDAMELSHLLARLVIDS